MLSTDTKPAARSFFRPAALLQGVAAQERVDRVLAAVACGACNCHIAPFEDAAVVSTDDGDTIVHARCANGYVSVEPTAQTVAEVLGLADSKLFVLVVPGTSTRIKPAPKRRRRHRRAAGASR
ncbi:MAG: hypothetical protein U1C49_01040 [Candidatus Andersenbacteria bacterium]|nr:hypothetical protein [bacterium]MDZ4225412.1 hypothetical protein [Candidatus Andersenbacteria bacterium]